MTVTVTNASFSENADKTGGIELARVRFNDDEKPVPSTQNNSVPITGVAALPAHPLNKNDFGVCKGENGGLIIYLKATANTTITLTLLSSTTGKGTFFLALRTFQVIMADVEHELEIARIGTGQLLIEANGYEQATDTGLRFWVTDVAAISLSHFRRRGDRQSPARWLWGSHLVLTLPALGIGMGYRTLIIAVV